MCSLDFRTTLQGSFRSWTSENAIPIVEKLLERTGTAFPLLKCLRTLYGRHCEPFSSQNALDCRTLHTQFQNFFFWGWFTYPSTVQKCPRRLDAGTSFRLARQLSHCTCFTKRPLPPCMSGLLFGPPCMYYTVTSRLQRCQSTDRRSTTLWSCGQWRRRSRSEPNAPLREEDRDVVGTRGAARKTSMHFCVFFVRCWRKFQTFWRLQ